MRTDDELYFCPNNANWPFDCECVVVGTRGSVAFMLHSFLFSTDAMALSVDGTVESLSELKRHLGIGATFVPMGGGWYFSHSDVD
jgi:hypothetical protein